MGFRENLKLQLQYSGMLVKELSALSGVKKSTIDSYLRERGYTPSVEAAVSIANALGVSTESLVLGPEFAPECAKVQETDAGEMDLLRIVEKLNQKDFEMVYRLAALLREHERGNGV